MKTTYTSKTVTRILNISKTEVSKDTMGILEGAFLEYQDASWDEHIVNVGNAVDDPDALAAALNERFIGHPAIPDHIEPEIQDLFRAQQKHKASYVRFVNE